LKSEALPQVRVMPGSTATGSLTDATINGFLAVGTVRLMRGRNGSIPTTIINNRAGSYTKGTGTIKTTAIMTTTTITRSDEAVCN
jgi:hypothetical protein